MVQSKARRQARLGESPAPYFTPSGRSGSYIYAVVLVDHPGVVKIGRTIRWKSRSIAYQNWNLRDGDGIADARVFQITDEYVDLNMVEAEILHRAPWPRRHKKEWFRAELDDVCRLIDRVLCEGDISYELLS